jgi:hypothetical protein
MASKQLSEASENHSGVSEQLSEASENNTGTSEHLSEASESCFGFRVRTTVRFSSHTKYGIAFFRKECLVKKGGRY